MYLYNSTIAIITVSLAIRDYKYKVAFKHYVICKSKWLIITSCCENSLHVPDLLVSDKNVFVYLKDHIHLKGIFFFRKEETWCNILKIFFSGIRESSLINSLYISKYENVSSFRFTHGLNFDRCEIRKRFGTCSELWRDKSK